MLFVSLLLSCFTLFRWHVSVMLAQEAGRWA